MEKNILAAHAPEPNLPKLRSMILYFLERGQLELGKTKLMKLLYFSDFGHYRQHHQPISGVVYEKWPQGPVPPTALDELENLRRAGAISRSDQPRGPYRQQTHLVVNRQVAELEELTSSESATLAEVWLKWQPATTTVIVEESHKEQGWLSTTMWSPIPYSAALLGFERV